MTLHTSAQRIALNNYLNDYNANTPFEDILADFDDPETVIQEYYEDWDAAALAAAIRDLAQSIERDSNATTADMEFYSAFVLSDNDTGAPFAVVRAERATADYMRRKATEAAKEAIKDQYSFFHVENLRFKIHGDGSADVDFLFREASGDELDEFSVTAHGVTVYS